MAHFTLNNKLFLIPNKARETNFFHYLFIIFSFLMFSSGLIGALISLLLPYLLLPYIDVNSLAFLSIICMISGIMLWLIHKYLFTQDWFDNKLNPPREIVNFTDKSITFQNPENHKTIKRIQEKNLDKIEINSIKEVKALPAPVLPIPQTSAGISTEKSVILKVEQTNNQTTTIPLKNYSQTYKDQKKLAGKIISFTREHLKTVDIEITN